MDASGSSDFFFTGVIIAGTCEESKSFHMHLTNASQAGLNIY